MNTLHHYDPDDPYPESDGLPMAENTEQYDWLVKIKENLEILFADRADVFVAGDLFWYPVADRKRAYPLAPDVMVVFGRPKGRRGSYRQWEEGSVAPQVVFEILSPSNSTTEMATKKDFYDRYGVEEYYVYDPDSNTLEVWMRQGGQLREISHIGGWVSPLLGIRFALDKQTLRIFYPSGKPFLNSIELNQYAEAAEQQAKKAEQQAKKAEQQAKKAEQQAKKAEQQAKKAEQQAKNAEQQAESERQRAESALLAKDAALAEIEQLRALLAEKSENEP